MRFLFAALTGGFLFFQSQATPHKAAEKLQSSLVKKYPGAKVEVEVEGKRGVNVINGKFKVIRVKMSNFQASGTGSSVIAVPNAAKKGSFGRVEIHLRDFTFDALRLDEADLTFNNIVYDFNALKGHSELAIVSVGPATSHFILPEASLDAVLQTKLPGVLNPKLSFSDGLMRISGARPTPVIGTPISFLVTAKPVARGAELWMENPHVTLGGTPMPEIVGNTLLGKANPIYIFDREHKWPFRVVASTITVNEGLLEINSTLALIPAPKAGATAVQPATAQTDAAQPASTIQ